jgi:AraC family transcriptional regulator, transcriptional activator of the genes for pyochelin and ferripyochelin receptors
LTICISAEDYENLWQENDKSINAFDPADRYDTIYSCPQQLGQGYERWIELPEIYLLIIDQRLYQDLWIEIPSEACDEEVVEFGFNLSGTRSGKSRGENFLRFDPGEVLSKDTITKILGGEQILKVDIHLSPNWLRNIFSEEQVQLSLEWQQLFTGELQKTYEEIDTITPAMYLPLQQLLSCPFQGVTRQLYLESKCLELIALKLEQMKKEDCKSDRAIALKTEDIDHIYQAKEILISNLDNPPSLLDLARQVGLNDCTLKRGFRQVFGTTVFGYLYDYRMLEAQNLLLQKRMSINAIARKVGYTNRSAFYRAFRKKFGISPSNYVV